MKLDLSNSYTSKVFFQGAERAVLLLLQSHTQRELVIGHGGLCRGV